LSLLKSPRKRTPGHKYAIRTRSDEVYEAVRKAIVQGQYAPGMQLSEVVLARELGVSRSPVRDALPRLVAEGFLEQVSGLGVFVRKLDRQDAIELCELRRVLEAGAAAMAAERAGPDEAAALVKLAQDVDRRQAGGATDSLKEADRTFHERVCALADNAEIGHALFMTGVIHLTFAPGFLQGETHQAFADHALVAQAIVDKAPDRAYKAMWDHFGGVLHLLDELPEFA
jgi:DNA-binding GntR family transcriptional regulator